MSSVDNIQKLKKMLDNWIKDFIDLDFACKGKGNSGETNFPLKPIASILNIDIACTIIDESKYGKESYPKFF